MDSEKKLKSKKNESKLRQYAREKKRIDTIIEKNISETILDKQWTYRCKLHRKQPKKKIASRASWGFRILNKHRFFRYRCCNMKQT